MSLSKEEALALKGVAVHAELKRAAEAFKREFTKPVTEWLKQFSEPEKKIIDLAKVYIRKDKDKQVLDVDCITSDLRTLVKINQVKLNELQTLLEQGHLVVADPDAVAKLTAGRLGKDPKSYEITVPGTRESLQWGEVHKGDTALIIQKLKGIINLEAEVIRAAQSDKIEQQ
jgi:hypothetical protein